jgi:hypothetical protein
MATLVGCNQSGFFFELDSATGSGTWIGPTGFSATNSLARDASGALYSVGNGPGGGPTALVRLDPATGAGTFVRFLQQPTDVRALAFSSADVLFAIRHDPDDFDRPHDLVTIDVATGAVKPVGNTGVRGIQALTFSPSGTLYGWSIHFGLVVIDPQTGSATQVDPAATPGSVPDIQSLAFAPDGTLYGAREQLYVVDPKSGAATSVGSGGYTDLRGIEFLGRSRRRWPPLIRNAAWLWTILAGGMLLTPIGPICIVCGDPLSEVWGRVVGAVTLAFGVLGLWSEVADARRGAER